MRCNGGPFSLKPPHLVRDPLYLMLKRLLLPLQIGHDLDGTEVCQVNRGRLEPRQLTMESERQNVGRGRGSREAGMWAVFCGIKTGGCNLVYESIHTALICTKSASMLSMPIQSTLPSPHCHTPDPSPNHRVPSILATTLSLEIRHVQPEPSLREPQARATTALHPTLTDCTLQQQRKSRVSLPTRIYNRS